MPSRMPRIAVDAMEDAGFSVSPAEAASVAVIIGCGLGGLETLEQTHTKLLAQGPSRVSPFFIPTMGRPAFLESGKSILSSLMCGKR